MASFSGEPGVRSPGSLPSNTNDVAHFLGAAVKVAVSHFADDHPAMAKRLNWPLELVNKNPAHALEMVRLDLARHAVVQHVTGQLGPRPTPPAARKSPPTVWDRAKTAARQEFDREVFAVTHPIEALANHIHDQRLTHGGERHLARANDLMGGDLAGTIANIGEGVGKAADFQRRYAQGGVVTDAVAKRFFGLSAPSSYADQAAKFVAPLRREAELRPPRTFAGEVVAGTPGMAMVMVPGIGPALLGLESLGAASNRGRQTHAPDTPVNDAAMAATAAVNTAAGFLLKGRGGLDPARIIERFPEAARGHALDLSAKVVANSATGAAIGGGQAAVDNAVAKATYDPDRPLSQGVGEHALSGALMGTLGRSGRSAKPSPRRPPLPAPPVPQRGPGPFTLQIAGTHKDVRVFSGYERHHIPSNSVSPLPRGRGLVILMKTGDHKLTGSHGSSRSAIQYRQKEAEFIKNGETSKAYEMGLQDILSSTGDTYREAVEKFIDLLNAEGDKQ